MESEVIAGIWRLSQPGKLLNRWPEIAMTCTWHCGPPGALTASESKRDSKSSMSLPHADARDAPWTALTMRSRNLQVHQPVHVKRISTQHRRDKTAFGERQHHRPRATISGRVFSAAEMRVIGERQKRRVSEQWSAAQAERVATT